MTDVAAVNEPEVMVTLGQQDAERLDKRVRLMAGTSRDNLEKLGRLLEEARLGGVHETLGFSSWPAYVADSLGGQLQLTAESRQAMVGLMYTEGMSERAIAQAIGASKSTIHRDIGDVVHSGPPEVSDSAASQPDSTDVVHNGPPSQDSAPDRVTTGLDGKGYGKPTPKAKSDGGVVVPRKVVERIAPRLDSMVEALQGLDPNEVDGDAVSDKVNTIRQAVGHITTFIDKVSPPPDAPEPLDNIKTRKPQIKTTFRAAMSEMNDRLQQCYQLGIDSRWRNTRFEEKDISAIQLLITGLEQIRGRVGKIVDGVAEDDVDVTSVDGEPTPPVPEATASGRPSPATMPRKAAQGS